MEMLGNGSEISLSERIAERNREVPTQLQEETANRAKRLHPILDPLALPAGKNTPAASSPIITNISVREAPVELDDNDRQRRVLVGYDRLTCFLLSTSL